MHVNQQCEMFPVISLQLVDIIACWSFSLTALTRALCRLAVSQGSKKKTDHEDLQPQHLPLLLSDTSKIKTHTTEPKISLFIF